MKQMRKNRVDLMLSQYELGDITGIPKHRIQMAEIGIPVLSESEAERIAKIFGLDPIPDFLRELVDKERYEEI